MEHAAGGDHGKAAVLQLDKLAAGKGLRTEIRVSLGFRPLMSQVSYTVSLTDDACNYGTALCTLPQASHESFGARLRALLKRQPFELIACGCEPGDKELRRVHTAVHAQASSFAFGASVQQTSRNHKLL